jgi:hypothetical protein
MPGGGLADADALCATEAAEAGLSGSFKALLAADGYSAEDRFDTDGDVWVRPDGVAITATAADLFEISLFLTAINVTADASSYLGARRAWGGAGSMISEGSLATTCNNWLSTSGTDSGMSGFVYTTEPLRTFNLSPAVSACDDTSDRIRCLEE